MATRQPGRPKRSAGLLLFRRTERGVEVFLAHPGGPFWVNRDLGAWTIPKGVPSPDEELLDTARREFEEETGIAPAPPFIPLGEVRQKAGKVVHAWAWEGDADADRVTSNSMRTEWPRNSGRWITYPEVDRCAWFALDAARERLNAAQCAFLDRLVALLDGGPP